jgi:precorrin-2 dehydrogenase
MKKREKSGFYPILINLQKFNCLVVGGGKVAYRKVVSLLEFRADITVISPKICKPLFDLSSRAKIKIIKKVYSKDALDNFGIIFCATDNPEISTAVYNDCKTKGKLLNVADIPSLCDFILPANILRGDLTISVSSQGRAPFYTKEIKRKLEKLIPPAYKDIIEFAADFRKRVLKKIKSEPAGIKANIFRKFTTVDWEKSLKEGGKKASQTQLQNILTETKLL